MRRSEIRIAGTGGQGVVTAGRILAEAAILSGKNATHTQVYGPQSRGGASRSDVVVSNEAIGYPLADEIGLLVVLSGEAFDRYASELGSSGRMIVDGRCAPEALDSSSTSLPVVDTARAICGGQLVTGVVALGALQAFSNVVDADSLRRAVTARVPARHLEMNMDALTAGMDMVGASEMVAEATS